MPELFKKVSDFIPPQYSERLMASVFSTGPGTERI